VTNVRGQILAALQLDFLVRAGLEPELAIAFFHAAGQLHVLARPIARGRAAGLGGGVTGGC
jgi:hypothetical protein